MGVSKRPRKLNVDIGEEGKCSTPKTGPGPGKAHDMIPACFSDHLKSSAQFPPEERCLTMKYQASDFVDYALMTFVSCGLCIGMYGWNHAFTQVVAHLILGIFLPCFAFRHGVGQRKEQKNILLRWISGLRPIIECRVASMSSPCWGAHVVLFWIANWITRNLGGMLALYGTRHNGGPMKIHSREWRTNQNLRTTVVWWTTFGIFYLSFGVVSLLRVVSFLHHMWKRHDVIEFLGKTSYWAKLLNFL